MLLISQTLPFNISATECPIETKFSVLDSAEYSAKKSFQIFVSSFEQYSFRGRI